jgi:hypothetical protein
MAVRSIMGPAGAPMKQPYGSFAGKPASGPPSRSGIFSVMGPGGSPMRRPYASFAGKPASGAPTGILHLKIRVSKVSLNWDGDWP